MKPKLNTDMDAEEAPPFKDAHRKCISGTDLSEYLVLQIKRKGNDIRKFNELQLWHRKKYLNFRSIMILVKNSKRPMHLSQFHAFTSKPLPG